MESVVPGAIFVPIDSTSDIYSVQLVTNTSGANQVSTSLTQNTKTRSASAVLATHPDVVYVEPDRLRSAQGLAPNDPQFGSQWALQTIGAMTGWSIAPNGFLTKASASSSRLKIAVLDSGADCTHQDFMNSGAASTDAAQGGQFAFALGQAYYPTTVPSPACSWQDDVGHGTHVAGIIGASANNGDGVAGLGYPFQLAIYKVLFLSGGNAVGADSVIAQGIIQAANDGAAVISMSLSGAGYSPTLQHAINYAWQRNVLVVAATGNNGSSALSFPGGANYVVGVGATDTNDSVASFSNYGNQVHVAAPGVNILSTLPGNSYGYMSGTSMATPFVSALAGLLANASSGISAAGIAMRIEQSADNNNSGGAADQYLGYGRINVTNALNGVTRPTMQGGITGQVVDYLTQLPVINTQITVAGQTFTTDSTGLFRFYGLPSGEYTIAASNSLYPGFSQQVIVTSGADTQFTIMMGGNPGMFTGTVTDCGKPVAGATVQALLGGLIQSTAVTGANGQYFLYVQPGSYQLQTSGFYHATTAVAGQTATSGGVSTVNLMLPSLGSIVGHIALSNGSPATYATISATNGVFTTGIAPDANGNYSTVGLPPGTYNVNALLQGLSTLNATVNVGNDSNLAVNFQFPDNGTNTILASIAAKTGNSNSRQWTLSFKNTGTNTVSAITVTSLAFLLQGGPACTPTVVTPLPAMIGSVGPGGTINGSIAVDFSSCTTASRFKVTMPFTENAQASNGTMTLSNQFQ